MKDVEVLPRPVIVGVNVLEENELVLLLKGDLGVTERWTVVVADGYNDDEVLVKHLREVVS